MELSFQYSVTLSRRCSFPDLIPISCMNSCNKLKDTNLLFLSQCNCKMHALLERAKQLGKQRHSQHQLCGQYGGLGFLASPQLFAQLLSWPSHRLACLCTGQTVMHAERGNQRPSVQSRLMSLGLSCITKLCFPNSWRQEWTRPVNQRHIVVKGWT